MILQDVTVTGGAGHEKSSRQQNTFQRPVNALLFPNLHPGSPRLPLRPEECIYADRLVRFFPGPPSRRSQREIVCFVNLAYQTSLAIAIAPIARSVQGCGHRKPGSRGIWNPCSSTPPVLGK